MNTDLPSPLRNYVVEKQMLASAILDLKTLVESSDYEDRVQELLVKLAQDRFNLVVVGQFKRGKSSLMNAILARDLLPTGYLPLTSAITALCYGPKDRAIMKFKGWSLEKEIELSELREYITEEGNPGNMRGLLYAQIETPSDFLRRGLYFIDTPGIGSSRYENTQTTYEFLPEADAIIFVTSVDAPLSEPEIQFMKDIQPYQRKLFVVVNKIDLIERSELGSIMVYIQKTLEQVLTANETRLFALSARQGMQAKHQKNEEAFRQSGLQEFQTVLENFLVDHKELSFLSSTLDRSLQLIEQMAVDASMNLNGKVDQMRSIKDRLIHLQSKLNGEEVQEGAIRRELDQKLAIRADVVMEKVSDRVQEKKGHLFSRQVCSICNEQSKAIFDYFASYQYELTRNDELTDSFLARKGFCHFHTWQFSQIAAPQGISAGYVMLIDLVLEDLRKSRAEKALRKGLLSGQAHCPACQFLADMETHQVQQLVDLLERPEKQEQYLQSGGLCLPHMSILIGKVTHADLIDILLETQINRFEELSEDLHSFLLKRAAIQRGLMNSEEQSAWMRAMVKMVGDRMVYHRS